MPPFEIRSFMRNPRTIAAFSHDVLVACCAWMLAFWLRFNFEIPPTFMAVATASLRWVLPIYSVLFLLFGLYRGLWRFASLADLQHMVAAIGVGAVLTTAVAVSFGFVSIPQLSAMSFSLIAALLLAAHCKGSK